VLAFDFDCWKAWRQRTARHDMFRPDRMRVVIKASEVAAPNVHGADAEACGAGIDAVEVHQALQGPLQLAGVVDAGGVNCSGWLKPRN